MVLVFKVNKNLSRRDDDKVFFIVKVYVNGIKRLISQAILDVDVRDLLFYIYFVSAVIQTAMKTRFSALRCVTLQSSCTHLI